MNNLIYYFYIPMLFWDITSVSVRKAAVNAVSELSIIVFKKVFKNVLMYILSAYVLST